MGVIAVLMFFTGAVFAGQGLGYIPGSFMTGDIHWFYIGSGLLLAAVAILAASFTVGRRPKVHH